MALEAYAVFNIFPASHHFYYLPLTHRSIYDIHQIPQAYSYLSASELAISWVLKSSSLYH